MPDKLPQGAARRGRRRLLGGGAAALAGAAAAASTFPSPAVAQSAPDQSAPELRWRLTSSFPKSLDTLYGGAVVLADAVAAMTDGRFQIQVFAAGELVPGLQAMDAVEAGTVECAHTISYYYIGRDPAFAFGACVPFGLNARMQDSWLYAAGGNELLNEFYAPYGIHALPLGNSGCQMGGWFRREIRTVADLKGLKFRTGGLNGQVLGRLGVVPQQIAPADIYPALERGAVDAVEWVGPYDDEKLGFHKVARYYYYPGFWDGGPTAHLFVNRDRWQALPPAYQAVLTSAAYQANKMVLARYDAANPPALKRLVAQGAELRPFSAEILDACRKAAEDLYAEINAVNPAFRRLYEASMTFRNDAYLWWQVAEGPFDAYSMRNRAKV